MSLFTKIAVTGHWWAMGPMYFFFCRRYLFSPSHLGSVLLLPGISLLLTNTVSPVRACLLTWWERFRETKKEDLGPITWGYKEMSSILADQ